MLILGLTGSAAMGKSTVAAMFAEAGVAIFDADRTVHRLYAGAAAPLVGAAFPGTVVDGVVDRDRLRERVLHDRPAMERLEGLIHPLVREAEEKFRAAVASSGRRIALLDIPLLFETGAESRVDLVIVVTAPPALQWERMMARPGMTAERLDAMLARQVPDTEKRKRAHFVIETSGTFDATRRQVVDVLRTVAGVAAGSARCGARPVAQERPGSIAVSKSLLDE